jgi:Flp pilus assembly protein TadG
MQLIKLTAASPGVRVGTRSLGKRVRARLRTSHEGGQAAVEFALVLPILLIVLTGIFWFGITLNHYLQLTNAVGIGGELLSVSRGAADPCAAATQAIANAAPLLNSANLAYTIVLTPQGGTGASYSSSCSSATLATGENAQVTVTYPCTLPLSIFSLPPLFTIHTPSCTLKAQVTELVQ